jgi:hypothetical protein
LGPVRSALDRRALTSTLPSPIVVVLFFQEDLVTSS